MVAFSVRYNIYCTQVSHNRILPSHLLQIFWITSRSMPILFLLLLLFFKSLRVAKTPVQSNYFHRCLVTNFCRLRALPRHGDPNRRWSLVSRKHSSEYGILWDMFHRSQTLVSIWPHDRSWTQLIAGSQTIAEVCFHISKINRNKAYSRCAEYAIFSESFDGKVVRGSPNSWNGTECQLPFLGSPLPRLKSILFCWMFYFRNPYPIHFVQRNTINQRMCREKFHYFWRKIGGVRI